MEGHTLCARGRRACDLPECESANVEGHTLCARNGRRETVAEPFDKAQDRPVTLQDWETVTEPVTLQDWETVAEPATLQD